MLKIGVLALQGAFVEHQHMLEKNDHIQTFQVRLPEHLAGLDGLVIPGGESTTIGKLATDYGLIDPLKEFAQRKPTWGTCAGLIFLARNIGIEAQPILGLMDIRVNRNAFGRQVDSFETDLTIRGIDNDDTPFHAVFIRAPVVEEVTDDSVTILSQLENGPVVAVQQGHLLGTAFHPELTDDGRVHKYFCDMVATYTT